MKSYKVTITEIRRSELDIDAPSQEKAEEIVRDNWRRGEYEFPVEAVDIKVSEW